MTTETVLTDDQRDKFVGDLVDYGTDFATPLYAVVESIEQAVLQSPEVQKLRSDRGSAVAHARSIISLMESK